MYNDTIRQGFISSINYREGRVRVVYPDKNNAVTAELPLLWFEYDMPLVGDPVYVAHQSNGVEKGAVLSRYFHDNNMPIDWGPHIHRKEYGNDAFMRYDREKEVLTLNFKNIVITGNVQIDGDVKIKGNVEIDGDALFQKNLQIDGQLLVNKDVDVIGDITISGDQETKNNFTVGRNVTVKRDVKVIGHHAVGNADIPDIPVVDEEKTIVEAIDDIDNEAVSHG